jgi:hypothetical protein
MIKKLLLVACMSFISFNVMAGESECSVEDHKAKVEKSELEKSSKAESNKNIEILASRIKKDFIFSNESFKRFER